METAAAPNNDDDTGDTCVICLSSVTERAITSCNHASFDFLCLVSWLQERSSCPLCKAEVTYVTYQHRPPADFKTYHVRATHPPHRPASTAAAAVRPRQYPPYRHVVRSRSTRRPYERPRLDAAVLRRRHVYREKLYSLHVGSNRSSRYQNWTPQSVTSSPELQSRARTWIRRELRVFSFLNNDPSDPPAQGAMTSSNAEFLLMYLLSILKSVDIKASDGHAEDLLKEFLGRDNARLFLHELNAWMRSPYTKLEDWDRHVQYSEQLPDEFDDEGRPVWMNKAEQRAMPERSRSPDLQSSTGRRERAISRRYEPE
ncbi:hypothetical protein K491DRAFT_649010 [Lophiostoma macrostomum CBS 122681]|uniref:RING-type E3 ubiquitin transferase n=1 Tax=Lophiostoma macrostomum CBS 122681 TaxID=1314788 RepID=A0A6A6TP44_9PLEO|nr:hypothetical protein K491DRAFT_649010 [Lophiostoma macrostomum CBS 122681]